MSSEQAEIHDITAAFEGERPLILGATFANEKTNSAYYRFHRMVGEYKLNEINFKRTGKLHYDDGGTYRAEYESLTKSADKHILTGKVNNEELPKEAGRQALLIFDEKTQNWTLELLDKTITFKHQDQSELPSPQDRNSPQHDSNYRQIAEAFDREMDNLDSSDDEDNPIKKEDVPIENGDEFKDVYIEDELEEVEHPFRADELRQRDRTSGEEDDDDSTLSAGATGTSSEESASDDSDDDSEEDLANMLIKDLENESKVNHQDKEETGIKEKSSGRTTGNKSVNQRVIENAKRFEGSKNSGKPRGGPISLGSYLGEEDENNQADDGNSSSGSSSSLSSTED
ncbi:7513_t:CDS:2 [Paraglomus brasilianum]|uniref:7513_t:CDS:1 n=1 Tax=Paraglomus brasilianum TaxID=144538 RepID=A0A9N9D859_9GLOM|nr:7513_t:CDS:2 [Paraglomus brasilianum]